MAPLTNRGRRRLIKIVCVTGVVFIFASMLFKQFASETFDLVMPLEADNETTEFVDSKCVLPKVDPFRVDVMKLIRKLPPIKCNGKKRYGTVVGQELRLDVNGLRKAEMKYIRRPAGDDFKVEFSEAISIDFTKTGMNIFMEWLLY